jgi:ABC-type nitrate/sulfonate/bicarbonate transport system substrate-binding protein
MRMKIGLAVLALLGGLYPQLASAAEKVTITTVADPAYESAVWALMNGKVGDPAVTISISTQPMARNPQSTMQQEFNLSSTGLQSVPALAEQGIHMHILATAYRYNPDGHADDIWVMKDSPYQTMADLKGKTIATQGMENQGTTSLRTVIAEKYGLKPGPIGGDFKWVELPPPQLEPALQTGKIDAAVLGTVPAFMAAKRGTYRSILHGSKELEALYGGPMPTVVWIAYDDDLKRRPDIYRVVTRLLRESSEYLMAHQDEVFASIAPRYKMEVADLKNWFNEYASMPSVISASDRNIYLKSWQAAAKLGVIQKAPASPDEFIWSEVHVVQ